MTGTAPCLSDLMIDRYLARELGSTERQALEDHAAACEGCAALLARRRSELEAFQARPELGQLAATTLHRVQQEMALDGAARPRGGRPPSAAPAAATRRWLPRLLPALGGLAVASAAVVLLLVWPDAPPPDRDRDLDGQGLRIKGGLSLGAFVKRGAAVQAARSGQVFRPGDELRFTYSARRGGHLALVGVDAAGVVTLYHPTGAGADRAPAARPGTGRPLPGSVILDATLGLETVVALLCPRPFSTRTLRRRAPRLVAGLRRDCRADRARSGRAMRSTGECASLRALLPAAACLAARFELDKRPAPAPAEAR